MAEPPHFPVLRSLLSPDALTALVETAYGLTVTRLELLKALILDTYRVRATAGRYILRVYPAQRRTAAAIAAELDFLEWLSDRGVPVSVPLRTLEGAWASVVTAPEGVRRVALFSYAPGRPPGDAPHIIRRYGEITAEMHTAGEAFTGNGARPPLDFRYLIDRPLSELAPRLQRHRPWAELQQIAATARAGLHRLPTSAPHFGYCHGDLCRANAHVDAEGRLILFDFDFCGPGWRIYDVATFLRGESQDVADAFLDGYEGVSALAAWEKEAIPLFQVAQSIWMLGLRASYLDEWGATRLSDAFLSDVLGEMSALLEQCLY
ncbi:MAG: phosphotransferase [Candidatus Promineifilaceae bacterium]|nr:phosphotransferase [Candidatus Promineifilaceae bacterium]